ncbi:uncharacterized protein [Littorina saxatilis]|uniref:uncharacterized protein n=1 Tax=Littorina saxatilis TaxID=31220 RepID=UPI0038B4E8FA
MAGDIPPLVLASRDKADMLDWIDTLIDDIMFINGPAQHDNCPSQGMTGGAKHQAEDRTDPSTCQQSGLSDAQGSGTLQQASMSKKKGWLHGAFWSMGRVKQHWHIERYCVLEGQSRLVIYKDDTKTKVNAVCHLQQALDVTVRDNFYRT